MKKIYNIIFLLTATLYGYSQCGVGITASLNQPDCGQRNGGIVLSGVSSGSIGGGSLGTKVSCGDLDYVAMPSPENGVVRVTGKVKLPTSYASTSVLEVDGGTVVVCGISSIF